MINRLAINAATFFEKEKIYDKSEVSVYVYGFELLFSTIINILGLLIVSLIMGVVPGAVLFVLAFVPIRLTAGGYHAKHHWSCILSFIVLFSIFAVILKFMNDDFIHLFIIISTIIAFIAIWLLSPIEASNKRLSERKKENKRKQSIILSSINMSLVILFITVPGMPIGYFAYYIAGYFAACMSLTVAVLTVSPKS